MIIDMMTYIYDDIYKILRMYFLICIVHSNGLHLTVTTYMSEDTEACRTVCLTFSPKSGKL